jgi:hypothetical protein
MAERGRKATEQSLLDKQALPSFLTRILKIKIMFEFYLNWNFG